MKKAAKKHDPKTDDSSVDTLLLEIKEEIKRDEMIKLINKHGKTLTALLILVVVAVAAFQIYNHYDRKSAQKAGEVMLKNLQSPIPQPEKFDKAAKNAHYSDLANLAKANVYSKTGDLDKALSTYEKIAKGSGETAFRDLATLNIANILLNKDATDKRIEKELKGLIEAKSSFSYTARDLLAVYYIQNSKNDDARKILEKLAKDANAPVTISNRAKQLLTSI